MRRGPFFVDTGAIYKDDVGIYFGSTNQHFSQRTGNIIEWVRMKFKETWDAEASLKTVCPFTNKIGNWGGDYLVRGV